MDLDVHSMPLTPRLEYRHASVPQCNTNDLGAGVEWEHSGDAVVVTTRSSLVDQHQNAPPGGPIACTILEPEARTDPDHGGR
jgi:hypothetical protein